jgi:hypothetical protein
MIAAIASLWFAAAPLSAGDIAMQCPPPKPFTPRTTARQHPFEFDVLCRVTADHLLQACRVPSPDARTSRLDNGEMAWAASLFERCVVGQKTRAGMPTAGREVRLPVKLR